ncbi:MAG: hypothetical protein HMLKMBBP_03413 [Planctomycetes bacterium]|nr:hypothetical protein [Planctomycetota bacterium]
MQVVAELDAVLARTLVNDPGLGGAIYSQRSATDANAKAGRAEAAAAEMQLRMDRMALACEAMWELVRERTGATDADLRRKIEEIDLRDGKLDGRIARTVAPCARCGRAVNSGRRRCIRCGAESPSDSAMS